MVMHTEKEMSDSHNSGSLIKSTGKLSNKKKETEDNQETNQKNQQIKQNTM